MMSFSDIFKKSFLEGFTGNDIGMATATGAMLTASLLALYIFVVYRVITRKTFYSKGFNSSLAGITVITAALILTIQSSIVVSLGMVGALSIVRFRTAIKDPMEARAFVKAVLSAHNGTPKPRRTRSGVRCQFISSVDELKKYRCHMSGCILNGVRTLPGFGRKIIGNYYGNYGRYGKYGKYGHYGAYGNYGAYGHYAERQDPTASAKKTDTVKETLKNTETKE